MSSSDLETRPLVEASELDNVVAFDDGADGNNDANVEQEEEEEEEEDLLDGEKEFTAAIREKQGPLAPQESKETSLPSQEDELANSFSEEEEQVNVVVQGGRCLAACCQEFCDKEHSLRRQILFYLLFLISFTCATTIARGDQRNFYMVERAKAELLERDFGSYPNGEKNFGMISSIEDTYEYIETLLLPFCFGEILPNGNEKEASDLPFVNLQNILLGGIRVRAVLVQEGTSCEVDGKYEEFVPRCYGDFESDVEEREPFGPNDRYRWYNKDETKETWWWGKIDLYPPTGYVVDLPNNITEASKIVAQMKEDNFIGPAVRVLFLDTQMYNPAINLHLVGRMALEFPSTGGVRPKPEFYALKANRYFGSTGALQLFFEIIVVLCTLMFIVQEVEEIREDRLAYLKDVWNILDWANLFVFFTVYCIRITTLLYLAENDPMLNPNEFRSFQYVVVLNSVENYLSCANAFFLWLKIVKYLKFNKKLSFLSRTFMKAWRDLMFFSVLFLIFFLGFAHAGYLAFSSDVEEFRSLQFSFVSLFRSIIGEMDYNALQDSSRVFGPIYYIIFQVLILLILVNVFLAIMNDAYSFVKEEDAKLPDDSKGLGMMSFFKSIMRKGAKGRKSTKKGRKATATVEDMDTNKDNRIDFTELIDMVKRNDPGITENEVDIRVKQLMREFDLNKDGHLDRKEQHKLQQALDSITSSRTSSISHSHHKHPSSAHSKVPLTAFQVRDSTNNNNKHNNNNNGKKKHRRIRTSDLDSDQEEVVYDFGEQGRRGVTIHDQIHDLAVHLRSVTDLLSTMQQDLHDLKSRKKAQDAWRSSVAQAKPKMARFFSKGKAVAMGDLKVAQPAVQPDSDESDDAVLNAEFEMQENKHCSDTEQ